MSWMIPDNETSLERVAWAGWPQTMECHWRVLSKETMRSDSLFRNLISAVMHILHFEGDMKGKGWEKAEGKRSLKIKTGKKQRQNVFIHLFLCHWLDSFGTLSKLTWMCSVWIHVAWIPLSMLSKLQAGLKENFKFVNCLRPQKSKISLSVIIPMCKIFDYLGLGQRLHVMLKVIMIVGPLTGVLGDALGLGPVTN